MKNKSMKRNKNSGTQEHTHTHGETNKKRMNETLDYVCRLIFWWPSSTSLSSSKKTKFNGRTNQRRAALVFFFGEGGQKFLSKDWHNGLCNHFCAQKNLTLGAAAAAALPLVCLKIRATYRRPAKDLRYRVVCLGVLPEQFHFSVCGGRREKGSSDASTASLSFSLRKYVNSATAHGDTAIKTLSLSHRTKFGFGWLPRIFKKLPSSDARMLLKISLGRLLAPSAKYFPADNTRAFQLHSIVEEEIGKLDDLFIHLASSSPFIWLADDWLLLFCWHGWSIFRIA